MSQTYRIAEDPFVLHHSIDGAADGPLKGLRLAVKDLFDVEGLPTACGTLDWPTKDQPASETAPTVQALLDAGATIVGKTITDELACSLVGQNLHYGTPRNPVTPDRVPGGSSSGSAAAVAGNLADLGLGTDTGGSIRIPGMYNNLYGLRPTHGRISVAGCMELCAPFDTVGLMTRDADTLAAGMAVLLGETTPEAKMPEGKIFMAASLFTPLEERMQELPSLAAQLFGAMPALDVGSVEALFDTCYETYRVLQGRPIWARHGAWIDGAKPRLAPDIEEKFRLGSTRTPEEEGHWRKASAEALKPISDGLEAGHFIVVPTGPMAAQKFSEMNDPTALSAREVVRKQLLGLTAMSPILGIPQIQIPLPNTDGVPRGLSVMGGKGRDTALLGLARAWSQKMA